MNIHGMVRNVSRAIHISDWEAAEASLLEMRRLHDLMWSLEGLRPSGKAGKLRQLAWEIDRLDLLIPRW